MFPQLARAAALGAALLVSLPATAGQVKPIHVSYADLDLSAAAGKAALERRIARAADSVCGGRANPRDLVDSAHRERCVASALDSVRPAVDLAFRNAATRQLAARDQSVRVAP